MKTICSGKAKSYLQFLGTLFLILHKIRREGLLAVERDVENLGESQLFNAIAPYDQGNEAVYTFVCDVLRLKIDGGPLSTDDMERYMDAYRKTTTLSTEQAALFDCARLSLIAELHDFPPAHAIEYGRHGIPAKVKPTFRELEDFLRHVKSGPEPTREGVQAKLESFYASLGAGRDKNGQ